MYNPWYENLTDKQISECKGDYIGCEICRNQERCLKIKLVELAAINKELSNRETKGE